MDKPNKSVPPVQHVTRWTEKQTERALDLISSGKSCAEIARILTAEFDRKFTKSGVIGKMNRLRRRVVHKLFEN